MEAIRYLPTYSHSFIFPSTFLPSKNQTTLTPSKNPGMHKHFRVIAISEHLRNHGFDPDIETHTRIPGIWIKLREFYDVDMIDERDNSFDYVRSLGGDEAPEEIYWHSFELPPDEFHDDMWSRAAADENERDIDWLNSDDNNEKNPGTTKKGGAARKRKRRGAGGGGGGEDADASSVAGSTTNKTQRSSTVDTDRDTPAVSSPVSRSARGTRSQKRAAAKAKTEDVESPHDEEEEEEEDEDEDNEADSSEEEEEEEEEEETEVPTTRSGRSGSARGRGRGARARGKAGRKKG